MKYLVLTAEYNSMLHDEFDSGFDYMDLNLPEELTGKLKEWYEDYWPIIQLNSVERARLNAEIHKLDKRGIELAKEVKFQFGEAKVKYYSEGLLKYIHY